MGYDWLEMFGSVKKMILGQRQTSFPVSDPVPQPRPQQRPPSTPPLPLRTLQLFVRQPETPVVLRDCTKVKGHGSGVRESWPSTRPTSSKHKPRTNQRSVTPPSRAQPVIEVQARSSDQSLSHVTLSAPPTPCSLAHNPLLSAAPQTHSSVPGIAPATRWSSEATMLSLLLYCHR